MTNLIDQFRAPETAKYKSDPVAADEILCLGAYPFDYRLDRFQTAALTMVASTVMNFDGAYMKR